MKPWILTMALVGIMVPMAGCETVSETASENQVRVTHAMAVDMLQVPNDLEYVLYIDRPVWLSRYPIPNQ